MGSRSRIVAALAFAGVLAASGCTPGGAPRQPGAQTDLAASDLPGAACRTAIRTDVASDPAAPEPLYLYCGSKLRPNGAVSAAALPLKVPGDTDGRRAVLARVAAGSAAGRDAAGRMSCRAGT